MSVISADLVRILYDYHYWAHHKVWSCVVQLNDTQFTRDLGWSMGSVHGQVVHMMSAEWIWFARLRGTSPEAMLSPAEFPHRGAMRDRWDEIEAEVRTYVGALDDARLSETLRYQTTKGVLRSNPIWHILLQVVNHGTDHRAQTLAMLNVLGAPTVEQDFMFYLREKGLAT